MILREFGRTGVRVPVIGQGTWRTGENARKAAEESRALRLGIELGMVHVDTAEMYGGGMTEAFLAGVIRGIRHKVFLAGKVLPSNASYEGRSMPATAACRG